MYDSYLIRIDKLFEGMEFNNKNVFWCKKKFNICIYPNQTNTIFKNTLVVNHILYSKNINQNNINQNNINQNNINQNNIYIKNLSEITTTYSEIYKYKKFIIINDSPYYEDIYDFLEQSENKIIILMIF